MGQVGWLALRAGSGLTLFSVLQLLLFVPFISCQQYNANNFSDVPNYNSVCQFQQ